VPDLPFALRLVLLVLVLGVLAAWDRWRHGDQANRWREYGFLLGCGLLGGGFAVLNDLLTATLSPDYFVVAKAIEAGSGFLWRVSRLAFHAGFLAGAVVGGGLLLVNQPRPDRPVLAWRSLLGWGLRVLALAVLLAPLGALVSWGLDPLGLDQQLAFVEAERLPALRAVWGTHAGLYTGGALGLVGAGWGARRARLSLAGTDPAPAR
jgi:hypothetical protein